MSQGELHVENAGGDEPVVVAGIDRQLAVRDVVDWALKNRPEMIGEAIIRSTPSEACCPPGFQVQVCAACTGSGRLAVPK